MYSAGMKGTAMLTLIARNWWGGGGGREGGREEYAKVGRFQYEAEIAAAVNPASQLEPNQTTDKAGNQTTCVCPMLRSRLADPPPPTATPTAVVAAATAAVPAATAEDTASADRYTGVPGTATWGGLVEFWSS
jgi:hypothetical protein